ncbi:SHOCT domain-containing protein [Protaetiibacter larvae]|uniref:Uncharacterized protein n=1 Tax=Protaetiibacter larvae TaxID=2592654 RepID=A0A5C1Y803_9MICO|nr:SHOCT domain-containing protein [Protaetiibacter larvae]QEO10233.1 hypothetical protein FLP23_09575 [Protaetiibacter larvae]
MHSTIALAAATFHPGWGGGWGFVFIPIVFWLLIIGLIITLAVTRRRRGWHPGPWGAGPGAAGPWASAQAARSAETVLAERYARGDIDEVEYRARLEVLRAQSPLPPQ